MREEMGSWHTLPRGVVRGWGRRGRGLYTEFLFSKGYIICPKNRRKEFATVHLHLECSMRGWGETLLPVPPFGIYGWMEMAYLYLLFRETNANRCLWPSALLASCASHNSILCQQGLRGYLRIGGIASSPFSLVSSFPLHLIHVPWWLDLIYFDRAR